MSQINNSRINRPATYSQAARVSNNRARAVAAPVNPRGLFRKVAVSAVAVGAIYAFVAGQSANASSESVKVSFEHVTVHSGETLWQLAQQYGKGQDARDWIANVVDLNGLTSVDLQPGQDLALPNN